MLGIISTLEIFFDALAKKVAAFSPSLKSFLEDKVERFAVVTLTK